MDGCLLDFHAAMREFLTYWSALAPADRSALARAPDYEAVFRTAFAVKHALQRPLMTGPPHHRVFSRGAPGSHPLDDPDSDSGSDDAVSD